MNVLVVNAGSSSLKYQLFDTTSEKVLAKGNCERIGDGGLFTHKLPDNPELNVKCEIDIPNHTEATKIVVKYLTDPVHGVIKSMDEIEAVGHRIVHGGAFLKESVLVDDSVLEKLEGCRDLAPLHTAAHLMGIHGCIEVMPNTPQIVVMDTAFHSTMPAEAYTYPLPKDMCEKYHIRRYGFHGTSHRYVSGKMAELLDKPVEDTKIITCHIGNGSSITAVKGGKVIDTSMGFTPLDGFMMGTRCGSIDPAIVPFIMEKENMSPDEMNNFMNKKCGFLGVSGISGDCREIEDGYFKNDPVCVHTFKLLAYQIKKFIGSYTAAMNGLDAIVFTAGIGENTPVIRELVCADMEFFGIKLDKSSNDAAHHQDDSVIISAADSKVKVYVIPTNEELVIAKDTEAIAAKLK
ncbi:MAG: acetate kinase [Ruminococcaceae bacterium]|nr:acetate kinase [Oscillospiraceae bacterium]